MVAEGLRPSIRPCAMVAQALCRFTGKETDMHAIQGMIATSLLALASLATSAQDAPPSAASTSPAQRTQIEAQDELLSIPSVAWEHLDLRYRDLGIEAYRGGDKTRALGFFLEAARYADKPAQALLAAMYWNGDGTAVDRPRAYAWMDLAADRGYRDLALQREAYWSRLSAQERAEALRIGKSIYDEYADEKGLHRLDMKLARARSQVTGSHTGYVGIGNVLVPGPTGTVSGPGFFGDRGGSSVLDKSLFGVYRFDQVYSANLTDVQTYAKLKDLEWTIKSPLRGDVKVGDPGIVPMPAGAAPHDIPPPG